MTKGGSFEYVEHFHFFLKNRQVQDQASSWSGTEGSAGLAGDNDRMRSGAGRVKSRLSGKLSAGTFCIRAKSVCSWSSHADCRQGAGVADRERRAGVMERRGRLTRADRQPRQAPEFSFWSTRPVSRPSPAPASPPHTSPTECSHDAMLRTPSLCHLFVDCWHVVWFCFLLSVFSCTVPQWGRPLHPLPVPVCSPPAHSCRAFSVNHYSSSSTSSFHYLA